MAPISSSDQKDPLTADPVTEVDAQPASPLDDNGPGKETFEVQGVEAGVGEDDS